ncbi:T9SS type A sorting domain-containing protein [bacterium]|nr:T9SS type A sorting domain-containing protein [bacterium]
MKISSTGTDIVPLRNFTYSIGASLKPLQSIVTTLGTIGCILMLLVVSSPVMLNAQTEWKDRYTSIAVNDQLNPSVAKPTNVDYTISVWEDERNIDESGSDIYIQRIDNQTGVSKWIADPVSGGLYGPWDVVTDRFDGIPVCTEVGDQRNPRAAYDGMNGVIVVWEDYRNDPSATIADIYAQRIDLSTGRPDPAWSPNGIIVCQTGAHAERPRIAGTVDGAFITWIDYRNDPGFAPRDRDVFLQYINSASATFPSAPTNWTVNGIPVAMNQPPDQYNPELAVDNIFTLDMLGNLTQGIVVTYQDDRYQSATYGTPVWSVFANRIDANGMQKYTTGIPPYQGDVAAGPSYESQEFPKIVTTGKLPQIQTPSAIIVWQDAVQNPALGYTDIYAQRIDQIGNQLFPGLNGLAVCTAPQAQMLPQPVLWESGDPATGSYVPYVTVGWEDHRNAQQTGIDLYAALINSTAPGMLANPAGSLGEQVCIMPYGQTELAMDNLIQSDPNQEFTVFVWTHETGNGMDIRYQKVMLPGWIEMWPVDGKTVTGAKSDQHFPQASREVFVWQDGRRDPIPFDDQDDENIYCQTPGECTGASDMKWRDMFAKWTFGRNARDFRYVINPDDGSTFVVWTEDREMYTSSYHSIVFVQKFDRDGVPRWSNNGIAVNGYAIEPGSTTTAVKPDVCIAKDGGAFVVWQQLVFLNATKQECLGAKYDAAGNATNLLLTWSWAFPNPSPYSYTEPRIVAGSNGSAAVAVLEDTRPAGGTGKLPKVAGLTPAGGIVPGIGGVVNTNTAPVNVAVNQDLRLSFDGIGTFYIMTSSMTAGVTGIVLGAISGNGISDAVLIPYYSLDGYDLNVHDCQSSLNISSALFTYSIQPQQGNQYDVYAGYYKWNGTTRSFYATSVRPNMPYFNSRQPKICSDSIYATSGVQGILLVWDTDYQTPGSPMYHRVESNRYLFPAANRLVPEFSSPLILADGLNASTYPDVARVVNSSSSSTVRGVVAWEGGGELGPCSPARPTEIYGQYVFYNRNSTSPGPQWLQAEMIGPGVGNYHQIRPNVQLSIPDAISVFWYDSQNGEDGVLGTRLPDLHQSIDWAKNRVFAERDWKIPSIGISGVWPQPAYVTTDQLQVGISGSINKETVVELFDLLGRKIASLFRGVILRSDLTIQFSPLRLNLLPGTYIIRYQSGNTVVAHNIVILR